MNFRRHLLDGQVIPAHPLALTPSRTLDERYQRALTRYYVATGAGGIAVGVHTTQFAIREFGMYRAVLALAAETAREATSSPGASSGGDQPRPFVLVAGLAGDTRQAVGEAEVAHALGYHCGLLSLGALRDADDERLIRHCRAIAEQIPLFGFYLQPAVGGRALGYRFWRDFASIPNAVAVKIAPFDRYATGTVIRAIAASGREDIALYTGNDDSIVADLLTPFPAQDGGRAVDRRIVGGLLGQWAVWTRRAVELLDDVKRERDGTSVLPSAQWMRRAAAITDANSAIFDSANGYAGCIPGIHEVLRRQGLMRGLWTLDARERLSDGQAAEISRVCDWYPELSDDAFVAEHRDSWLR